MAQISFDPEENGEKAWERMQSLFSPGQVDQFIRQAIQFCWMSLAPEKRNLDEVERQLLRIVNRALTEFREDAAEFRKHLEGNPPDNPRDSK